MVPSGSLRNSIKQRVDTARQSGALQPIASRVESMTDGDVRFLIRVASNLASKDAARQVPSDGSGCTTVSNPFLKPDPRLVVGDIGPRHICVLNKYNVVDEHVLLVTKQFEQQESPLVSDDFRALSDCLGEFDALAFYNSGPQAGASQQHKHMQLVPLPLSEGGESIPLETVLPSRSTSEEIIRCPAFPFRHGAIRFGAAVGVADSAAELCQHYERLLRAHHLDPRRPSPYNLLLTRKWMFLVPRSREHFEAISLNAMAFAGAFFVRNLTQLQRLKSAGPISALRRVGYELET